MTRSTVGARRPAGVKPAADGMLPAMQPAMQPATAVCGRLQPAKLQARLPTVHPRQKRGCLPRATIICSTRGVCRIGIETLPAALPTRDRAVGAPAPVAPPSPRPAPCTLRPAPCALRPADWPPSMRISGTWTQ